MRLEPRKNAHIVVESMEKLRRRGVTATLDIFGDGSERPQLEEMCRSLGVEKSVRFHGTVPQTAVVDALTQMDILCFPSTASEGFPKAVFEALAAGVPVVSTGVSVLGHLIHQGIGRQISSPDSESLAAAVEDLVSDPSRFATISAQAHEASRQYSMENWRKTIAALLEEQWGLSRSTARSGESVASQV
jgi:glycosyltransferase involved in cell wall biosynthesis